jgi:hypothetical protein
MTSQTYETLNKAWKSTCRVLLGDELGELKDNEAWLSEFIEPRGTRKSAISGKDTYPSVDDYCNGAKFISFDEIDFGRKFEPLNINEIKDIDSALGAIKERMYYAGNIMLGKSRLVEGSSNVTDSIGIYRSYFADGCEYAAHCINTKASKYIFGINGSAFMDYAIRSIMSGPRCQRIFESYWVLDASDIYYSSNLEGCSDCLFCFNLRGRRNAIGNLQLPKDKYLQLKKKLVADMLEHAKSRKTSFMGLLAGLGREKVGIDIERKEKEPFDIAPVQEAFETTYKIMLGRKPGNIDSYGKWLEKRRIPEVVEITDTASNGGPMQFGMVPGTEKLPRHRIISEYEAAALAENPIALNEREAEGLSLDNPAPLSKLAFSIVMSSLGKNRNLGKAIGNMNASDCYAGLGYVETKYCGFCFWPRESSYIFGSCMAFNSSFCIKSYYSKRITRAFEVDSCTDCADIYYAHNCENVHDSMFCFNVKNLRNAIGNGVLPLEKYKAVKKSLVGQIANELEKKKDLKWDIYNIGCAK